VEIGYQGKSYLGFFAVKVLVTQWSQLSGGNLSAQDRILREKTRILTPEITQS
jgi:hypothetical protein